ncbi:hypothetical protein [Limnobacter sp.]|uniref:hypothetical protein n=1 Tax=Limnobacter sp. TaxID=2003368 RepID=UPI0025B93C81|nr:hypothetical protein [Limnobacter sp.]
MNKMTIAKKGRGTDTVLGHLTKGELVIPRELLASKELKKVLKKAFDVAEADMDAYIVGNPKNSINPETGHPEFFLKKLARGVRKFGRGVRKGIKKVGKKLKQEARNFEDNVKDLGRKIDDEILQPTKDAVIDGVDKLLPEKVKDDILGIDPPKLPKAPLGNPKEAPKIEKKKKKKKTARSSVSAARSRMSTGNKSYRAGGNLSISGGSGPNVAG